MAGWNGSGVFTFPYSWTADAAAGIDITASRMDTQFATVSDSGFANTLTRDGQGSATANLPMNGFRHTGAGAASGSGDYVILSQVTGAGALNLTGATLTTTGTATVGTTLTVGSGQTITTGGLTVVAGGLVVDAGGAGIVGGLTVTTGGLIVQSGTIALSPTSANVGISPNGGSVVISPISGNVTISPPSGNVVINPGTAGTIDRMVIGGTVAAAGTFTTLIANNGTTGSQVLNYSQFPATTGSPGTMTFPNGVIEKWGTSTTASGTATVTFGVAFPTACDNVQITISGASGTTTLNALALGTISASQFVVWGPAATAYAFHWRAIGH